MGLPEDQSRILVVGDDRGLQNPLKRCYDNLDAPQPLRRVSDALTGYIKLPAA